MFQMFDINMQRAEACTHKISFQIVVLQSKGTFEGPLSLSNRVELLLSQWRVKSSLSTIEVMKGTNAIIKNKEERERK